MIDASQGEISINTLKELKPIACLQGYERFPDIISCDAHVSNAHMHSKKDSNSKNISK